MEFVAPVARLAAVTREVRALLGGGRVTFSVPGRNRAVSAVIGANQEAGTHNVPDAAQVLIDELTLCGDPEHANAALESWYQAGAEMPALVLPVPW